jgi:hypothetical protein
MGTRTDGSSTSTRTFRVEKLDVACHKLDGPICDAYSLLDDKNAIHHVYEAVFERAFADEFDAITGTNCLCLGRCLEVNLVEGDKILLVVSRRYLSLLECLWYRRRDSF